MSTHILPLRVYYEDTDAGGIVYHANYLNYFERARTEFLRDKGFSLVTLYNQHNIQFVIHSANIEYLQPARLDQLLYVVSEVKSIRPASLQFVQGIYLALRSGSLSLLENLGKNTGSQGGFLQEIDVVQNQNISHKEGRACVGMTEKSCFDVSDLCCKAEIRLACVDDQLRPKGLSLDVSMELKKCLQINR